MTDTTTITLPSGIEAEIQELTAEAERILTSRTDIKSGQWLNKFMAKALVSLDGKTVPTNQGELINLLLDMKSGDRNYLMLRIRMISYGEELIFNYECPKCHKVSGYKLNLQEMLDNGDLKIYPFSDDVPVIVETRSGTAEVDYMTGRTEQWLAQLKNVDTIHYAMAACRTFNGEAPKYKVFEEMYTRDLSKIRAAFLNLKGGLDPKIELDCPECDSSNEVMLYQLPDFFTPLTTTGSIGL